MEIDQKKVEWLEYDLFKDYSNLTACTFLKRGGLSEGPFFSLNMSDTVGDHFDAVKSNRDVMKKQIKADELVFANQSHSSDIKYISLDNLKDFQKADGLITKEKGIGLVVTHADCQAAVFFDPENEIIGVTHAGWKGLVKNIYKTMIQTFLDLGSKRENIKVAISPSIGPCHFEFKNYQKDFPKNFYSFQEKPNHFNLWDIAFMLLREEGILSENIEIDRTCTYENEKDFFSYRREKVSGRNGTVILLKSK